MADDGWNSDEELFPTQPQNYNAGRSSDLEFTNSAWKKNGENSSSGGWKKNRENNTNGDWRKNRDNGSNDNWRKNRPSTSNASYSRNGESSSDVEWMSVPSNVVGKIIGRGGSKIKELQTDSGARININNGQESSDTTSIKLGGDESSRTKARQLIEALIEERPDRGNRSNHNQRGWENPQVEEVVNEPAQQEVLEPIDWDRIYAETKRLQEEHWATLPPILKNFYNEDPTVASMSPHEVAKWREQNNNIMIERDQDEPVPNPIQTFEQAFSTFPEVLEQIKKQGFEKPSPIQSQAWPLILSGQDMIGIAQTGTGKTLAYLLPAFIHIERQPVPMEERDGPNVLILAPTRELVVQIDKEIKKYPYKNYKSVSIYGGASRSDQIEKVAKGVQIVVATPGRLNDLVKAKHLNIEAVTYLVLDEADRMLDLGFGPQIRVALLEIRPTRQTVMTSATWPSGVQRLAELYARNPVRVIVGSLDLTAVHSVKQQLLFVEDSPQAKYEILLEFLKNLGEDEKVIVFCGTKAGTIAITVDLALQGIKLQTIYGSLDQEDREQSIEDMKDGSVNILIATDIASRGIDIENVTYIINFDFPMNLEEFVHRVGRAGRAGKTGTAISYITYRNWDKAEGLIKILEEANQEVPEELYAMAERFKNRRPSTRGGGRRGGGGGGGRSDSWGGGGGGGGRRDGWGGGGGGGGRRDGSGGRGRGRRDDVYNGFDLG